MNIPRVWLVAGPGTALTPSDHPTVRDDQMRTWRPSSDGRYRTGQGRHCATWGELRARYDLLEVTEAPMTETILDGTR
jgi:hypothetical protein